jgi:uncharacterized membrane protein
VLTAAGPILCPPVNGTLNSSTRIRASNQLATILSTQLEFVAGVALCAVTEQFDLICCCVCQHTILTQLIVVYWLLNAYRTAKYSDMFIEQGGFAHRIYLVELILLEVE